MAAFNNTPLAGKIELKGARGHNLKDIDLGVVLVADRGIARRLGRTDGRSLVSLDRVVRTLRTLPFLARGPSCVYTLSVA